MSVLLVIRQKIWDWHWTLWMFRKYTVYFCSCK